MSFFERSLQRSLIVVELSLDIRNVRYLYFPLMIYTTSYYLAHNCTSRLFSANLYL